MTFRLEFRNSNDDLIYIQIDPFAGIYRLRKGEGLEIEAAAEVECATVSYDENKT